jgi:organic hydroperoxide reductase OsmC/OhrA
VRTRDSVVAERQAPLRALYHESPQAAVTRKTARTSAARVPASDPFNGEVEVGHGYGTWLRFGLDRQVGGLHDAPNPGDLLCAALAACEDGALRMIANLLGVELSELEVEVNGELDVRGCLGAAPAVRVGFTGLECKVRLAAAQGTDPKRLGVLRTRAPR